MRRLAAPTRLCVAALLCAGMLAAQDAKLWVTAFDEKTGEVLRGLGPQNFTVSDGSTPLRVVEAEYSEDKLDVVLLADASAIGEGVRPLVAPVIERLAQGDQMALVAFEQSATLLQDFTGSKDLLLRAWGSVRYGNNPRILDALYAVLDGGFEGTVGRRAAIVMATGVEGSSETGLREVLQLARRRGVQIHFVYREGADSGLFEKAAGGSGGAYFFAKKLDLKPDELAARVYAAAKGRYELQVDGVSALGDRIKVEIAGLEKGKGKPVATALAVE
ncbi:MAG: VWA domain-containing protein [Acidobacteria bacterium]|nr:VWA domain-containing protein [Acidobacteriota bacterium]